MKILEDFLNDDYDEIADEIISECSAGEAVSSEAIEKQAIVVECDDPEKAKNIINILKRKILFKGIVDGWLPDEYFV